MDLQSHSIAPDSLSSSVNYIYVIYWWKICFVANICKFSSYGKYEPSYVIAVNSFLEATKRGGFQFFFLTLNKF